MKQYGKKSLYVEIVSNGDRIYYSYTTPVCYYSASDDILFFTGIKYSVTTSKHVNLIKREYVKSEKVDLPIEDFIYNRRVTK